jgi:GTP-binding protein Era
MRATNSAAVYMAAILVLSFLSIENNTVLSFSIDNNSRSHNNHHLHHHHQKQGSLFATPASSSSSSPSSKEDEQQREEKSSSKPSKTKTIQDTNILLEQLAGAFDYDGRLPSKILEMPNFRCGFISILGAPNMGKSTLLNALLKEDLCIATRRPQTTRHAILGVLTTPTSQLCLIDTPGIIDTPAYKLQEGMMEAVKGAFQDSDALLVVTDLFSTPIPDDEIFAKLLKSQKPIIVAINKIDLEGVAQRQQQQQQQQQQRDDFYSNDDDDDDDNYQLQPQEDKTYTLSEAVSKWRSLIPNALAIIPVSATDGVDNPGVHLLRQILVGGDDIPSSVRALGRPIPGMFQEGVQFISDEDAKSLLPLGPPLYDEELLTDRSERFFVSEIIRESLFECLKKEVPYCCEAVVDTFTEPKPIDTSPTKQQKGGASKGRSQRPIVKTLIEASIYVERESQKGIVVGKGGQQIKEVGIVAREKIEKFLGCAVKLDLSVKVQKDWRKKEDILKQFGYLKE